MPTNALNGREIVFIFPDTKRTDMENTKAIFAKFEPIALPIARIVLSWSADSIDIKISGAEVAIPIMKKLAINPEIENVFENRSVELTSKFDPSNNSINPAIRNNVAAIILD